MMKENGDTHFYSVQQDQSFRAERVGSATVGQGRWGLSPGAMGHRAENARLQAASHSDFLECCTYLTALPPPETKMQLV